MEQLGKLLQRNFILVATYAVMALSVFTVVAMLWSERVIGENLAAKTEAETVKERLGFVIRGVVQRLDVGIRGFAVSNDPKFLKVVNMARADNGKLFDELGQRLAAQQYPDPSDLDTLRNTVNDYLIFTDTLAQLVYAGNKPRFDSLFKQDKGTNVWETYAPIAKRIVGFEDKLTKEAEERLQYANNINRLAHGLLLFIGLPTLVLMLVRLRRFREAQNKLLTDLARNNRQYLFDSGKPLGNVSTQSVVKESIDNYKEVYQFISKVAEGRLDAEWAGLNEANQQLNQQNLAGKLVELRERLKATQQVDEQRKWAAENLTKFSEVVRAHQADIHQLTAEALRFILHTLSTLQGGLFVLEEGEANEPQLALMACFAYNRKKYIQKSIAIGEGLVGQVFAEAQTTLLSQIPPDYTSIEAGLATMRPSAILLVPIKYNDKVEGVIEISSLQPFEPHHVEFAEKAGEYLAAALASTKATEKMRALLQQSQQQTEMLRLQEEETRQNVEELHATQEAMKRKQEEAALTALKYETILEGCADAVVMINEQGIVFFFNQSSEKLWGYHRSEVMGQNVKMLMHAEEAGHHDQYLHNYTTTRRAKVIGIGREVEARRKDGSKVPILLTLSQATVEGKMIFTSFIKDISYQKELEAQAQMQLEELRAQEEELRQNMEELLAIQEELEHKNRLLERQLSTSH